MEERKNLIFVGFLVVVFALSLVFLFYRLGALRPGKWKEYNILFENVKGLPVKAEVRIAGVKVGYVDDISLKYSRDKVWALVKIKVEDRFEVRRDFMAQIRAKSLLGEKYIELVPTGQGDTSPAPEGFTITKTSVLFEPDEFLMAMRGFVEAINPEAIRKFSETTLTLLEKFEPMVKQLEVMMSWMSKSLPKLESMTEDFHRFILKLDSAFNVFQRNRNEIELTFKKLPQTLEGINSLVGNVNSLFFRTQLFFDGVTGQNITKTISLMPYAVSETVFLIRQLRDITPRLLKLIDEVELTLKDIRKIAEEGVKVRIF